MPSKPKHQHDVCFWLSLSLILSSQALAYKITVKKDKSLAPRVAQIQDVTTHGDYLYHEEIQASSAIQAIARTYSKEANYSIGMDEDGLAEVTNKEGNFDIHQPGINGGHHFTGMDEDGLLEVTNKEGNFDVHQPGINRGHHFTGRAGKPTMSASVPVISDFDRLSSEVAPNSEKPGTKDTSHDAIMEKQRKQKDKGEPGSAAILQTSPESALLSYESNVVSMEMDSAVSAVSNAFARGVNFLLTKEPATKNLPMALKFEARIHEPISEDDVNTEFKEVTELGKITRVSVNTHIAEEIEYLRYAYPQDGDLGNFLYYDGQNKLDSIATLVKLDGRNDLQFNLKAIGKDPPDCELKNFTFGFQDVKSFCWASTCKKKNGKKLDNFFNSCFVFEKDDGTYGVYVRDAKKNWQGSEKMKQLMALSLATSKSIVVSIAVALCVFFSD